MKTSGELLDGTKWEQLPMFDVPASTPRVLPPRRTKAEREAAEKAKEARAKVERYARVDTMSADGWCVTYDELGCGWRHGHSPHCRVRA